mgnify:FL=1
MPDTTCGSLSVVGTFTGIMGPFSATGFEVDSGESGEVEANVNGVTYHWVAFGIDSDILEVGSYSGTVGDNRTVTLTNTVLVPRVVICVGPGGSAGMGIALNSYPLADRPGAPVQDETLTNGLQGITWSPTQIQRFSIGGFEVGDDFNSAGTWYFAAIAGTANMANFTYTGTGADGLDVVIATNPFQPLYVLLADETAADAEVVTRYGGLAGDLSWDRATAAAANLIQAFNTDGFEVGTHADVNTNTRTYHCLCFADGPVAPTITYVPPSFPGGAIFASPDSPYAAHKTTLAIHHLLNNARFV